MAIRSATASKADTTTTCRRPTVWGHHRYLRLGGSDLVGVNAIGGVVNFQTLDPTPTFQAAFTQWIRHASSSSPRACERPVRGTPRLRRRVRHQLSRRAIQQCDFYQTGAAFDQSARSGPVHDLGVYADDSATEYARGLLKLRYNFYAGATSRIRYSGSRWVDKTGNGDGDFLLITPRGFRQKQLSSYDPGVQPSSVRRAPSWDQRHGEPNGFGRTGSPTAVSPARRRSSTRRSIPAGTAPARPGIAQTQRQLAEFPYEGKHGPRCDVYNQLYEKPDRSHVPASVLHGYPGSTTHRGRTGVNESGAMVSDDFPGTNNDFEFGTSYVNNAYFLPRFQPRQGV